jgi:hypothetical protein
LSIARLGVAQFKGHLDKYSDLPYWVNEVTGAYCTHHRHYECSHTVFAAGESTWRQPQETDFLPHNFEIIPYPKRPEEILLLSSSSESETDAQSDQGDARRAEVEDDKSEEYVQQACLVLLHLRVT